MYKNWNVRTIDFSHNMKNPMKGPQSCAKTLNQAGLGNCT